MMEIAEKRARQRRRADLLGGIIAASLLAIGFLVGRASAGEPEVPAPTAVVHAEPVSVPYIPPLDQPAAPEIRYPLTDAERGLVERVVMAEAGSEDFDGQALVAQCILNTAEARDIRPDAVVLEKNQYARPAAEATDQVIQAVAAVFDEGYTVTEEPVRWFYAPRYCAGRWHETSLVFVLEHGGHRFFMRKE